MGIDFKLFEQRSLFYMANRNKISFGGNPQLFNLSIKDVDLIKSKVKEYINTIVNSKYEFCIGQCCTIQINNKFTVLVYLNNYGVNNENWEVSSILLTYDLCNNCRYEETISNYGSYKSCLYFNSQLLFNITSYNTSRNAYIYNNLNGYSIKYEWPVVTLKMKYRTTTLEYMYNNNILECFTYTISSLKNGPVVTYKNGIIKKVITYDMGVQHGYYYFFNKKGQLVNKYDYHKGKRHGESWQDLDKKKPKVTYYFDGELCKNKEEFDEKTETLKPDNIFRPTWLPRQVEVDLEDIDLTAFMEIKDITSTLYNLPTLKQIKEGYYPWM